MSFRTDLTNALGTVEQHGFGADVDADSTVEDAARRHLNQLNIIGDNIWAEHADYTVEDWQLEVANNATRSGYHDWVAAQREANAT